MTSSENEITQFHIAKAWKDCIADLRERITDMSEEECRVLRRKYAVSPNLDIRALVLDVVGGEE